MKFQLGIVGALILNSALVLAGDGGESTETYRELQHWKLINAVCIGNDAEGNSAQMPPESTSGEILRLQADAADGSNSTIIKAEDLNAKTLKAGSKIIVIDSDKVYDKEAQDKNGITIVHRSEGQNQSLSFYVQKTIKKGQEVSAAVATSGIDTEFKPICTIGNTLLLSFQNVRVDLYKDPNDIAKKPAVKKADKKAKKKQYKNRPGKK